MARVHAKFLEQFPEYDIHHLKDPLIIVIDMIHGFIHEGALHDKEIDQITPAIKEFIELCKCRTVFFADAHPVDAREFQSFPSHCVIGSRESEIVDELKPFALECYLKNSTNAFHSTGFQHILTDFSSYKDIIIVGCCSDICIMQFALTLQSWLNEHGSSQHKLIVPINMIDTYHIDQMHDVQEENEFSIRNMAASGIQIVRTIERGKHNG